jgi:cell division protein ZapE
LSIVESKRYLSAEIRIAAIAVAECVSHCLKGMSLDIQDAYLDVVRKDGLLPDVAQQDIVDALQKLQLQLESVETPWQSMLAQIGIGSDRREQRGLYIYGGVGRGKTFLMDLFFANLKVTEKRRIHFHRIMREVHERLKRIGDQEDPLDKVAAEIAVDTRVLCFDEFFVSDIADAMILGRLLEGLFARGVTLVTTSNSAPKDLYQDGLQRERFLPAISMLEQHTDVIELGAGVDYRFRLLQKAGTYLSPGGEKADETLQRFFSSASPGDVADARTLNVLGRNIRTRHCAKGVAWFDFSEICDGPRSQNDYIEIARWFQTVIISDVPILTTDLENSARRFIALVDEFYDRRVKLILSAETSLDNLYQGKKLEFEFRRTESRLSEMQSADYLHEAHIA